MDMYKFGGFILLIGAAILCYGLIVILTNLDKQFDRSQSNVDPFFGRMDLQNALEVRMENQQRSTRRSEAIYYLVAGGIVGFVGYAMRTSAKTKKISNEPVVSHNIKTQVKSIIYCNNCGNKTPPDAEFCPNCGTQIL